LQSQGNVTMGISFNDNMKVWASIIHVNFNYPFELCTKFDDCILYSRIYGRTELQEMQIKCCSTRSVTVLMQYIWYLTLTAIALKKDSSTTSSTAMRWVQDINNSLGSSSWLTSVNRVKTDNSTSHPGQLGVQGCCVPIEISNVHGWPATSEITATLYGYSGVKAKQGLAGHILLAVAGNWLQLRHDWRNRW